MAGRAPLASLAIPEEIHDEITGRENGDVGSGYRPIENEARAAHAGAWAGEFEAPARFRHYPKARFH